MITRRIVSGIKKPEMKKDQSFHDYVVHDLLRNLSGITSKTMFGGWGIYENGVIFALIADGELYFKVGDNNRADFEKMGSHPFVYSGGNHKPTTMPYWLLPEEIMENEEKLHEWVLQSVEASKQSKKKKGKN